jgi:hypothetical protein
MKPLVPRSVITFRFFPKWQFWKHSFGLAEIIAFEETEDIVHVRIIAVGPSVIAHMPILKSKLLPYITGIRSPFPTSAVDDEVCRKAVSAWRERRTMKRADAFRGTMREAFDQIYRAAPNLTGDEYVESVYPILDEKGQFGPLHIIRVAAEQVTAPDASSGPR